MIINNRLSYEIAPEKKSELRKIFFDNKIQIVPIEDEAFIFSADPRETKEIKFSKLGFQYLFIATLTYYVLYQVQAQVLQQGL